MTTFHAIFGSPSRNLHLYLKIGALPNPVFYKCTWFLKTWPNNLICFSHYLPHRPKLYSCPLFCTSFSHPHLLFLNPTHPTSEWWWVSLTSVFSQSGLLLTLHCPCFTSIDHHALETHVSYILPVCFSFLKSYVLSRWNLRELLEILPGVYLPAVLSQWLKENVMASPLK